MSSSGDELFFDGDNSEESLDSQQINPCAISVDTDTSSDDDRHLHNVMNPSTSHTAPELSPFSKVASEIQRHRYKEIQADQLTRPLVSDKDNRGYYIPPSTPSEKKHFRDEYILLGQTVKELYPHLTKLLQEAVGEAQRLEAQGNTSWYECPWTWTGALKVVANAAGGVAFFGGIVSAIPYWDFSDSGWIWFCIGLGLGKEALPWIRNIVRGSSVGANLGLGAEWAQAVVKSTLSPPDTDAELKESLKNLPSSILALIKREPLKVGLMMFALYCGFESGSFNYITAINPYNQARALITGVLGHLFARDAQKVSLGTEAVADDSFVINGLINAYGAYRVLCWLLQRLRSGFQGAMERVVTTASKTAPIIDILSRNAFRAYLIDTFSLPATTSYKIAYEALQRLSGADRVRVVQAFGESFGKTRSPSCTVERGLAGTTLTVAAVGTIATGKYVWENSLLYLSGAGRTYPIMEALNYTLSSSIASWLLFGCGLFVTATSLFSRDEKWERYMKKYTLAQRILIALCETVIFATALFSSFSNGGVGGQELFSENNEPGDYSVGSWNSFVLSFSMAFFVNRVGIADWVYGLDRGFWNIVYWCIQKAQRCFSPETIEGYYPNEPGYFVDDTLGSYRAIYTLSEEVVFDRYPFVIVDCEWPQINKYNVLYVQFHTTGAGTSEPKLQYRTMRSDQRGTEIIGYITAAQLGEPLPTTEKELNAPHMRATILMITSLRQHTSLDEVYRCRFEDDRWAATLGVATATDPNTDAELVRLTAEKARIDRDFNAAREGIAKREIADVDRVYGQQNESQEPQHEERIEILRRSAQLLDMLSQKRQHEILRLRQQRQARMDIVADQVESNQRHLDPRGTQQQAFEDTLEFFDGYSDLEAGQANGGSSSFWSSICPQASSGYEVIRNNNETTEMPSVAGNSSGCWPRPGAPSDSESDEEEIQHERGPANAPRRKPSSLATSLRNCLSPQNR
jgi:hypothetical protein